MVWIDDVKTNVALNDLGHHPVDRASASGEPDSKVSSDRE